MIIHIAARYPHISFQIVANNVTKAFSIAWAAYDSWLPFSVHRVKRLANPSSVLGLSLGGAAGNDFFALFFKMNLGRYSTFGHEWIFLVFGFLMLLIVWVKRGRWGVVGWWEWRNVEFLTNERAVNGFGERIWVSEWLWDVRWSNYWEVMLKFLYE